MAEQNKWTKEPEDGRNQDKIRKEVERETLQWWITRKEGLTIKKKKKDSKNKKQNREKKVRT